MTIHKMRLSEEPFGKVINRNKIIESRLFDEKRQLINIGDKIEFSENDNPGKKVTANVIDLYRYDSFEDLFSEFPPEYFGGTSKEALIQEIGQFYSRKEQDKYGVIGIRIELQE